MLVFEPQIGAAGSSLKKMLINLRKNVEQIAAVRARQS
jgi:hypothetical protein